MVGKLFTQQGREEDMGNCIVADIRVATEESLSSATNSRTMKTHKKWFPQGKLEGK